MGVCVLVLLQPLPGEQAGGGALHCQPHGSGENYRHLRQVRALTTVSDPYSFQSSLKYECESVSRPFIDAV